MPDWSASSPFLAEVYDEQQLLQQRDMLLRRREELRKQRDKLKSQRQQEHEHRYRPASESRESYPSPVSGDSNPLIPRPVIDETEEERHQQLPAASFHNSGERVSPSGGSEVPYIARDTVFNDKEGTAARSIPVSSFESYRHSSAHQQPSSASYREAEHSQQAGDRNLRRESEQGRSPDAIHLHYFSRVRQ